jgi:hypothetical protein
MQVFCPAAAAVAEVLAVGNQALMQVAGEQRDAVGAGVVAEEMAGHADLAAAGGAQHVLIKPGPIFDLLVAGGLQTGEGDRHQDDSCGCTPVLAGGIGLLGAKQLHLGCIRTDGQGILPVTGPWHGGR